MLLAKKLLAIAGLGILVIFFLSPPKIEVLDNQASIRLELASERISGTINGLETEVLFDAKNLSESIIRATLEVGTLSTGNMVRDIKFGSRKYLHKKKHPVISFKSLQIKDVGNGYLITGELTIKDITKETVFHVGYTQGSIVGVGSINLMDYGIELSEKRYENKMDVYIDFPLARPE
ncbi:YceI family protein [Ascidiimonas sp. W6]|uniref:YceI family protein n=1 Tax=Ascidiimonas meishanensis TaxID=3128903 RepID=UPI0030EF24A2